MMRKSSTATDQGDTSDGRTSIVPLRVIDVGKTIDESAHAGGVHFTRSRHWHVISHTWSADVREFSKIIGERTIRQYFVHPSRLQTAAQVAAGDSHIIEAASEHSYEALFRTAQFQSVRAYQNLIEFLMILRGEGVRWVWFDALCINQTDNQEKEFEIQHMGTYYQQSMGSYVLQHGLGRGFKLLLQANESEDMIVGEDEDERLRSLLPRWFSRAWTFQEWVLPTTSTFIVDLTSEERLRKIARIVLIEDGGCLCCAYETSLYAPFLHRCIALHERANYQGSNCTYPDSLAFEMPLVEGTLPAKIHFWDVPGMAHWYFADDLGYGFLVRLKFHLSGIPDDWNGDQSALARRSGADYELVTKRFGVKNTVLDHKDLCGEINVSTSVPSVIREIAARECSNSEDRLLSVLKLLGVEGAVQVRTGQSLETQLLHLAQSLIGSSTHGGTHVQLPDQNVELLMQLCLVDGFGNETPGMSWLPAFEVKKGSWQEAARLQAFYFSPQTLMMEAIKPEMRCRGVCATSGMLEWGADMCAGQLLCTNNVTYEKISNVYQSRRTMVLQVEGREGNIHLNVFILNQQESAHAQSTCTIVEDREAENYNGALVCSIAFRAPGLHYIREAIPVWLLKVGTAIDQGIGNPTTHVYWLVCIRETQEGPLHKIGYMGISVNALHMISLFQGAKRHWSLIGGLGAGHSAQTAVRESSPRDTSAETLFPSTTEG